MINKQRTIASSTIAIAAVITLFASGPLVATHQANARFGGGFGGEQNPATGNPHPSGEPTGNPHQFPNCSGNPHGQTQSGFGFDQCNGAQ
jgi:hypothetical protein